MADVCVLGSGSVCRALLVSPSRPARETLNRSHDTLSDKCSSHNCTEQAPPCSLLVPNFCLQCKPHPDSGFIFPASAPGCLSDSQVTCVQSRASDLPPKPARPAGFPCQVTQLRWPCCSGQRPCRRLPRAPLFLPDVTSDPSANATDMSPMQKPRTETHRASSLNTCNCSVTRTRLCVSILVLLS